MALVWTSAVHRELWCMILTAGTEYTILKITYTCTYQLLQAEKIQLIHNGNRHGGNVQ